MEDFHIQLDLSFYDTMMMSQMIAHARRYGDNQLSDWAGDLRTRMDQLAGGKPSAIKPETDPVLTEDAQAIIETSRVEKPAKVKAGRPDNFVDE